MTGYFRPQRYSYFNANISLPNSFISETKMDLFKKIVDESVLHPHIKTVMLPGHEPSRDLVMTWAEGFPDRDGKFVQEFQTTFNSSFWEVYLYAVFSEYGFAFDWSESAPDFLLKKDALTICVEAVTANAADGKPREWERPFTLDKPPPEIDLDALNREAMVRLANSIHSKYTKYLKSYAKLPHVVGKPFVLAVAPFEQPDFNLQYNRPIKAVLYDHYVDEPAYLKNPAAFPNGPPNRQLGYVTKDNGAEIQLGFFNDESMRYVSAVLFSCTATWGKVDAMAPQSESRRTFVHTVWGSGSDGKPIQRIGSPAEIGETITDGLQIYHNPFALYPLAPDVLRRQGVVQNFFDTNTNQWVEEGLSESLFTRQTSTFLIEQHAEVTPAPNSSK